MQRAFIHVAGPAGCGKTTFVEALLTAGDAPFVVGRCTRDDSVRRIRESSPRNDPELQRYRRAGAWAAAVREVPERRCESGRLFTSRD